MPSITNEKENNLSILPRIIDNQRKSLLDLIKNIADKYQHLSIAAGYWDLLGTQMIFDNIKNYKKIRLLIGREPLIPRHKELRPEPDYPDKDFFYDLERLQPSKELKELVKNIKKLISEGILEVKVYRKNFLHAKCYIFGDYSSDSTIGIIGSSNFTKNGLTHNTELNALEPDHRIVAFKPQSEKQEVGHLFWFDQFWNDPETENWNGKFTEILRESPVGDALFSPYETYIKTLYELYQEELIEEDLDVSIKGSCELFDFQVKNAQALIRRLKKYKVAMLSDSVGLGKTYTAIEVIKQYLSTEEGKRRIEIICPKSLKAQWTKELTTQGVMNLSPVTLQNPREIEEKRSLDDIASVSLFVIDESHNLKNRAGKRFEQIIDWMKDNPKAHVLLLTATPINNQLNDVTNQILLGTRGDADIFKVTAADKKLKQTVQIDFYQAIENLKKKISQDITRDGNIDYDYIRQIMSPILRAFVVRRTRQGIQKEYGGLKIAGKERHFPTVIPEVKKYGFKKEIAAGIRNLKSSEYIDLEKIYSLSIDLIIENTKSLKHPLDQIKKIKPDIAKEKLEKISAIHFVYQTILLLGFLPYKWRMYQTKFYGKTRKQIKELKLSSSESKFLFLQISIYGILRTMFLKRLESSIYAIRSSLNVYERKLKVFEKGVEAGKIISVKDLLNIEEKLGMGDEDFNPDDLILDEDEELDTVDAKKYNLQALKEDIKKERLLIELLSKQLEFLEKDDSKIKAFADLLEELNKTKPAGSKVLIFSFYADTVSYLENSLKKYTAIANSENTGFLSSKNRAEAENLAGRFSPESKKHILKDNEKELNYLFSTDILSEGQNLQDCGILVNYDLHWNPVRMIQRNGRINRLGTAYPKVYIYNINPESKLEEYLKLVQRLEGKINLIRNTIGTDTPVLDEEENPIEFVDSWKDVYSDDLEKRMKALEQAEKDADFLLSEDEYVSDLKIFHNSAEIDDEYKKKIYNISSGKWAVMPENKNRGDERPDVLAFNSLHGQNLINAGHSFVSMKKDGNNFQAITHLQALEWLKSSTKDNKRPDDHISLDKINIINKTSKSAGVYIDKEDAGAPVGQQVELLRLMHENHFKEEEIIQMRKSFQTSNILDKQKIIRLTRKIVKSKRSNEAYLDLLNELIKIAYKTLSAKEEKQKLDHTKQILFYVKENE